MSQTVLELIEDLKDKNLTRNLVDKTAKKWSLKFVDANPKNLEFLFLGNGQNKLAFRIAQRGAHGITTLDWVLVFQNDVSANPVTVKQLFEDEINILVRLGNATNKVMVPAPFADKDASSKLLLFQTNVYNEEAGNEGLNQYAFVLQYFDLEKDGRYLEMPKVSGTANFMTVCLQTPHGQANKKTTLACLQRIHTAWNEKPWGDFQVMYDKQTGDLLVFDPMAEISDKAKWDAIIAGWLKDLGAH